MIKKFKSYALTILAVLTLGAPMLVPISVSAAACATPTQTGIQTGANLGDPNGSVNCDSTAVGSSTITTTAKKIVNIFSIIVGAISVIMIIYGGFRYITSGGDSGRVGNAKNTLIYAVIGLVIVALAQLIVHFVLSQSANITTG